MTEQWTLSWSVSPVNSVNSAHTGETQCSCTWPDSRGGVSHLVRIPSHIQLSPEHTSCHGSCQNAHSGKGDSTSERTTRKQPLWPLCGAWCLDWRLVLVVKRNVESTCTQPLAFSIYFLSTFTEPVRTGLFARTGCDSGARSQEPGFL